MSTITCSICTAQVRPFRLERVPLVLHTYIPCWRRRVIASVLVLTGLLIPQYTWTLKE